MRFFEWLDSMFHPHRNAPGPTTPSQMDRQPADVPLGSPGDNQERRLHEGLEETMPGSDPVSTHIE